MNDRPTAGAEAEAEAEVSSGILTLCHNRLLQPAEAAAVVKAVTANKTAEPVQLAAQDQMVAARVAQMAIAAHLVVSVEVAAVKDGTVADRITVAETLPGQHYIIILEGMLQPVPLAAASAVAAAAGAEAAAAVAGVEAAQVVGHIPGSEAVVGPLIMEQIKVTAPV